MALLAPYADRVRWMVCGQVSQSDVISTGWAPVDRHLAERLSGGGLAADADGAGVAGADADGSSRWSLEGHRGGLARGMVHEWFGVSCASQPHTGVMAASAGAAATDHQRERCVSHALHGAIMGGVGARGGGSLWFPPVSVLAHLGRQALLDGLHAATSSRRVVVWIGATIWPHPRLLRHVADPRDPVRDPVRDPARNPCGDDGWTWRGYHHTTVAEPHEISEKVVGTGVLTPDALTPDDRLLRASIFVRTDGGDAHARGRSSGRSFSRGSGASSGEAECDRRVWAIDLAARNPAVAAVIADGSGLRMAQTRRLQLAAEAGGALVLLARPPGDSAELSAAGTRWMIETLPPTQLPPAQLPLTQAATPGMSGMSGMSGHGAIGRRTHLPRGPCGPRWRMTLCRHKGTFSHDRAADEISTTVDEKTHRAASREPGPGAGHGAGPGARPGRGPEPVRGLGQRLQALGVRRGVQWVAEAEQERVAHGPVPKHAPWASGIEAVDGLTDQRERQDVMPGTGAASPQTWILEWNHATGDVRVSPHVVDRSATTPAGASAMSGGTVGAVRAGAITSAAGGA